MVDLRDLKLGDVVAFRNGEKHIVVSFERLSVYSPWDYCVFFEGGGHDNYTYDGFF